MIKTNRLHLMLLVGLSLVLTNKSFSQIPQKVNGEAIKKIITHIASDEFKGRESGTSGGILTENFFANEFQKLNLKPAGENGTFFYFFTMPFYKVEGNVNLTIGKRFLYYGRNEDYSVERYADGGKAKGEIVFAGYGITSIEKNRNDFEGLNLQGKIVLIKRGSPGTELHTWRKYASDSVKAEYCYKHGAAGVLFFEPARYSQTLVYAGSLSKYNPIKNFPIFRVDERIVRYIFQISGNSYINMVRNIDRKVVSFKTGKIARMSANVVIDYATKVRNVLAMIPGTDSTLKHEAIIIGGHMDHIGTDEDGTINNGADDNASGSSVTLGIAQAMVKNNFKPLRTIIFACWAGEEHGLLGSKAWCANPTWDLNKVVVYFNLDMVGLGDGNLNMPGTAFAPEVWKFIKENTDSVTMNRINPGKGGLGGSDHNSFLLKGVPSFAGKSSGEHPTYHQPDDDPVNINADVIQFVGDFIFHCTDVLGNATQNFINATTFSNNRLMVSPLNIFALTPNSDYQKLLADKNIAFSLINVTEKTDSSYEKNFFSCLKLVDDSFKLNFQNKQFVLAQNFNDVYNYSNSSKTSILLSMNLSNLGYNELYCKALVKYGVKFGVIDSGVPFAKIAEDSTKFIRTLHENGLGTILRNLTSSEISSILSQVTKPSAIMNSDIGVLTEDIIKTIKSKGHLFVYLFDKNLSAEEIIKNIEDLRTKLGPSFTVSPSEVDDIAINKFKDIYFALIEQNMGDDFIKDVFSSNIKMFLAKVL